MVDVKCKWCGQVISALDYIKLRECNSCFNLRQRIENNLSEATQILRAVKAEKRFELDAATPIEKAEQHIHFTKNSPVHAYTNRLLQDLIDIIAGLEGENGKS